MRQLNFSVRQGERFQRYIYRKIAGVLTDMTGWSARGQIRLKYSDPEPIVEFHFALEAVGDENNRRFSMWLTPDETAGLPDGAYYYDVEMIPPLGEEWTEGTLEGIITIRREVTR